MNNKSNKDMKAIRTKTIYIYDCPVSFSAIFSLDDDCKNGVCDFSLTGEGVALQGNREHGIRKGEMLMGGCCHDEIVKHFPDWAKFVPLHLSNEFGQPMYPVDNFIYHIKQRMSNEDLMKHYRCTEGQLNVLKSAIYNKDYFRYCLFTTGLIEKWRQEAEEAIKYLEEKSGVKFTHTSSPKFTLQYDEEWMQEMNRRKDSKEFTPESFKKQVQQSVEQKKANKIQDAEVEYNAALEFITRRKDLAKWCANNCLTQNYRFWAYNGVGFTKQPKYELTINACSWEEKVTKEEYESWLNSTIIPEGLIVKFEENN